MKKIWAGVLIIVISLALVGGFMGEVVYASNHQACPCCTTNNNCHSSAKCHNTSKVCSCSHQVTQASSQKSYVILGLIPTGYLAYQLNFTYLNLFVEDFFHPPKA